MGETHIHATAVVHPSALLGQNVRIGPFAVIDEAVRIGDDTEIGPHVYITGQARLGRGNRIHAGCVIGDLPQDLRFAGGPTPLTLGDHNVLREYVTVHRSNKPGEATTIGSHCLLMVSSHVGHNAALGDHVILVNGALLAGHVTVGDRAFISGHCLVHQFVRIGTLALMQGGAAISKDLPPYTVARGVNGICGLNTIGLRRAGISSAERLALRHLYKILFRSGLRLSEALEQAATEPHSSPARLLLDFLAAGRRGFCADPGRTPSDPVEPEPG